MRQPREAYYTPSELARALVHEIGREFAPDLIVEPHVGQGAFAEAAIARWPGRPLVVVDVDAESVDQAVRRFGSRVPSLIGRCESWLDVCAGPPLGSRGGSMLIVGNPPYGSENRRAVWPRHVAGAVDLARRSAARWRVAMLLDLRSLAGGRGAWWIEHPPAAVVVLNQRPAFVGGGSANGEYALVIWGSPGAGAGAVRWLDWRAPKPRGKAPTGPATGPATGGAP